MNKFPAILNTAYKVFQFASCDVLASEIRQIQHNYNFYNKKINSRIFNLLTEVRKRVDEKNRNIGNKLVLEYLVNMAKSENYPDTAKDLQDLIKYIDNLKNKYNKKENIF